MQIALRKHNVAGLDEAVATLSHGEGTDVTLEDVMAFH